MSPDQPLALGAPIEIAFDRLLLPSSVTRQGLTLQDLFGNYQEPAPSYDPVARVVRMCAPLQPDQTYKLTIVSPQSASDPDGLRAIDGALLDPSLNPVIEFPVVAGPYLGPDACPQEVDGGAGAPAALPSPVDFCSQVLPIVSNKCGGGLTSGCHNGSLAAEGLDLTSVQGILATAIGRVSQESNTGSTAAVAQSPAGTQFGVNMAIVAAGDPADSWLLYKLLMAVPPPCSSTPPPAGFDAGAGCYVGPDNGGYASPDGGTPHDVPWAPLSDSERATLAGIIPGREMPFPVNPALSVDSPTNTAANLTLDELETISQWILQGATVTTCNE